MYILISVVEREIATRYFDCYESAYKQMLCELRSSFRGNEAGYQIDSDYGKDTHSAWSNAYNYNYDWLILDVQNGNHDVENRGC